MARSCDGLLLLHHLRVNLNFNHVAYRRFTGLEKIVVEQIEILAVDGRGRGKSAARIPPRVGHFGSRSINVESDFESGSVDGQIANDQQLSSSVGDSFRF